MQEIIESSIIRFPEQTPGHQSPVARTYMQKSAWQQLRAVFRLTTVFLGKHSGNAFEVHEKMFVEVTQCLFQAVRRVCRLLTRVQDVAVLRNLGSKGRKRFCELLEECRVVTRQLCQLVS